MGGWQALTVDVRKAHKLVKVKQEERGLLLFWRPAARNVPATLCGYNVCHFGASFSAYWWSRVGAWLVRAVHQLLFVRHGAWLYVDDLLVAGEGNAYRTSVEKLRKKFRFGSWNVGQGRYLGLELKQHNDGLIEISDPHYHEKLVPVKYAKDAKDDDLANPLQVSQ